MSKLEIFSPLVWFKTTRIEGQLFEWKYMWRLIAVHMFGGRHLKRGVWHPSVYFLPWENRMQVGVCLKAGKYKKAKNICNIYILNRNFIFSSILVCISAWSPWSMKHIYLECSFSVRVYFRETEDHIDVVSFLGEDVPWMVVGISLMVVLSKTVMRETFTYI